MTDPFKNLNKISITEEKRFDMAFVEFQRQLSALEHHTVHDKVIIDLTFKNVDGFIARYLERHAK